MTHPLTDREALIAGIAADPDNDLRRLVFADWLEENGEPERAAFIRFQIEAARLFFDDVKESLFNSLRAKNLFSVHWRKWFSPFAAVFDPGSEADPSLAPGMDEWSPACRIVSNVRSHLFIWARIQRGFAETARLNLAASWASAVRFRDAIRIEPVSRLSVRLTSLAPQWSVFSGEWLRHLRTISLLVDRLGWPGDNTVFHDPNLAGVRSFSLNGARSEQDRPEVPAGVVQRLADSPLGERLEELSLTTNATGMRELCRRPMPGLRKLTLRGELTVEMLRYLNAAPFAPSLTALTFGRVRDSPLVELGRVDSFSSLVDLNLGDANPRELGVLADWPFLTQLQQLVIEPLYIETERTIPRVVETRLQPGVFRMTHARRSLFDWP